MAMSRWSQARPKARLTTRENRHIQASRTGDQRPYRRLASYPSEPAPGNARRCGFRIEPVLKPIASLQGFIFGRQLPHRLCGGRRARPIRGQSKTLPLSAAPRPVVCDHYQLEPRTSIARPDGSRRLRSWDRYRYQSGTSPYLGTGSVRGGACGDAQHRRHPFQFAPDHGQLRRNLRPRFCGAFNHAADRLASIGAFAGRAYPARNNSSPQARIRNAMMFAVSTLIGARFR